MASDPGFLAVAMQYPHGDERSARDEADRLRRAGGEPLVVGVRRSPYGGFRVRSVPASLLVDLAADGLFLGLP